MWGGSGSGSMATRAPVSARSPFCGRCVKHGPSGESDDRQRRLGRGGVGVERLQLEQHGDEAPAVKSAGLRDVPVSGRCVSGTAQTAKEMTANAGLAGAASVRSASSLDKTAMKPLSRAPASGPWRPKGGAKATAAHGLDRPAPEPAAPGAC